MEIGDSADEDEDYGWQIEDEDEAPPLPSQWQGSEDILLQPHESDEDVGPLDDDGLDAAATRGDEVQDSDDIGTEPSSPVGHSDREKQW